MRRKATLSIAVIVLVLTSVVPAAVAGPAGSSEPSATDWPAARGDASRTGANAGAAPTGPNVTITHAFPAGIDGPGEPTTPAVVNGTMFVGYDRTGGSLSYVSRGSVVAYNTTTGSVLWNQSQLPKIQQTPTVHDRRVYVSGRGPYDDGLGAPGEESDARGGVFALNASTGEIVWARNDSEFDRVTAHIVTNDRVYVKDLGRLIALNATTGATIWTQPAVSVEAISAGTDTFVTVSINDTGTTVVGRDIETGETQWRTLVDDTDAFIDPGGVSVVDGTIYLSDGTNVVTAIAADDGTTRWHTELSSVAADVPAKSSSAPAVANGMLFVSTTDDAVGTAHALDAETGEVVWQFEQAEARMFAPTVANGTVYVPAEQPTASSTPTVREGAYALDATTGALLWNYAQSADAFPGSSTVATTPVAGTLYLQINDGERYSNDGGLYALQSTEESVPPWNQFASGQTVSYAPHFTITTTPPNAFDRDLEAGTNVTLTVNATDPDGTVESIRWDVGGDGTYDRTGDQITLSLDYCGSMSIEVRVTDDSGEITTKTRTLSTT